VRRALAGVALVASTACAPAPSPTWGDLLPGEAAGYALGPVRRGGEHDVVAEATDAAGRVVEVHVLDPGTWAGAVPAGALEVAWEAPRTSAPDADAEAVVAALARHLATTAPAGTSVDDLRLDGEPDTLGRRALAVLGRLGTRARLPWLVPLALLLSLPALRGARATTLDALGVALGALGVRLALGAYGPLHTNGQGDLWLAGARDPAELARYGPGYAELYGLVARLHPPDTAVYVANAVASAGIPALAVALGHRLGLGRTRALLVGAALALDPVAIRVAATEAYFVPAALLAAWAGLAATSSRPTGPVVVALLAAAAARLHPTAWAALAVAPLLAAGQGWRAVARSSAAAGLGAVAVSGCVVADVLRAIGQGELASPEVGGGSALLGAVAGGALVAVPRARTIAPAAGAALMADLLLRGSYGQGDLWQQAFDRLFAVPVALGVAALLPAAALRARTLAAGGALAAAAGLVLGAPLVRSRTIDDAEHAWARGWLATVPAGCRVLYVAQPDATVTVRLPPPPDGVAAVPIDARGPVAVDRILGHGCVFYVRTSACGTTTGAAACARVEAGLPLGDEVGRATLPAVPNHRDVHYPGPTVDVAAFRVTGPRAP
jgi:hypothetical protein